MTQVLHRIYRRFSGNASSGHARVSHGGGLPASRDYQVIDALAALGPRVEDGWHSPEVAARQDEAFATLLAELQAGNPRVDFLSAAQALQLTGLADPTVLEIGCGSGYYAQALAHLLKRNVRYTGCDYSPAMIDRARKRCPGVEFQVADATALPFPDRGFDVAFSGGCLMHVPRYPAAVRQAARVARSFCIFHTVPLLERRPTTFLRKMAYGGPTVEVIFNRAELMDLFEGCGLVLRHDLPNIEYDLRHVLGEPTHVRTLVCEVKRP